MWKLAIIIALAFIGTHVVHGAVLDINQMKAWYPNYLNESSLSFMQCQKTSISAYTFSGLSQLNMLHLGNNVLTQLESSIFTGLSQLYFLYLNNNQLTSLDSANFNGLSQLIWYVN